MRQLFFEHSLNKKNKSSNKKSILDITPENFLILASKRRGPTRRIARVPQKETCFVWGDFSPQTKRNLSVLCLR
jgi:hypothetical protein